MSTDAWLAADAWLVTSQTVRRVNEGRFAVTRAPETWQRLEQAEELAEVLDAAYDAFAELLWLIRGYEESQMPFYAALVMAAAAAADGRAAIAAAPSLPAAVGVETVTAVDSSTSPSDTAASLAALSKLVGSCLFRVAATASKPSDRRACEDGARFANEVYALASGQAP